MSKFPPSSSSELSLAIDKWATLLGHTRVLTNTQLNTYQQSTSGIHQEIAAALLVENSAQVQSIVRIALEHSIPIYPISTGNNWGYGTMLPPKEGCVIVDLSALNSIIEYDETLGLVTVEPGVTQQQLSLFLRERNAQFVTPITGSSPHCSVLANALERGFGLTPTFSHARAITALKSVLGTGEIYQSVLSGFGDGKVAKCYQYGIGPDLDSLFIQSSYGVVIEATLQLARSSDSVLVFSIDPSGNSEENLKRLIDASRETRERLDPESFSLKISNNHYLSPVIEGEKGNSDIFAETKWKLWGALYGEKEVLKAKQKHIKKQLSPYGENLRFISESKFHFLSKIGRYIPQSIAPKTKELLKSADIIFSYTRGIPCEKALEVVYSTLHTQSLSPIRNPARDGCGVLWYPAVIPYTSSDFMRMWKETLNICANQQLTPIVSSTAVSSSALLFLVMFVFDQSTEKEKAWRAFDELFQASYASGAVPYRAHSNTMSRYLTEQNKVFWQAQQKIKSALDPKNIISPGRYSIHIDSPKQ